MLGVVMLSVIMLSVVDPGDLCNAALHYLGILFGKCSRPKHASLANYGTKKFCVICLKKTETLYRWPKL
jgi:hypothetical protein